MRLPFEGPGCGSSSRVRNVGDVIIVQWRGNPNPCLCVSTILPRPLQSSGCRWRLGCDGAGPGCPSFTQLAGMVVLG